MKRGRVFQILFNLSSWTKELVWSVGSRGAKTRCWAWWSAPTEREPGNDLYIMLMRVDGLCQSVCLSVTKIITSLNCIQTRFEMCSDMFQ